MDFQEAWAFLDNLQFFKIKLGLDSMNGFLDDVGHPQRDLDFVHVAGTNGKGSMAAILLAILSQAGFRVGLYTSPHLSSVRERFRINGAFISEAEFAELATRIRKVLDGRQITYFEFTTALALLWFAKQKVDLAILEVGMGGRLDATNVITPLVSVITNVSMDHEAYLGNTLAEVAAEKAGIIKPGVPVVSAVADDASRPVVEEACCERNAPLYLLDRDFSAESGRNGTWSYRGFSGMRFGGLAMPLKGNHQAGNAALALATLEVIRGAFPVDEADIRHGLAAVCWPGRLEYFRLADGDGKDVPGRRFLLDGAHNPAGAESLAAALRSDFDYRKLVMVWGSMADKDLARTLSFIAPLCDTFLVTSPEGERSAQPEQLRDNVPDQYRHKVVLVPSVSGALSKARHLAGPDDLICVAGSLYLVGAARLLLLGEVVG